MKFTTTFTDTAGKKYITGFRKLAPSIKTCAERKQSPFYEERFIQWRTFLFNEDDLKFKSDTLPNGDRYTLITKENSSRYLNQLRISVKKTRATLYPYPGEFVAEQAKQFVRISIQATITLITMKCWACSFLQEVYLPGLTFSYRKFKTDAYHLNLTGPKDMKIIPTVITISRLFRV